MREKRPNILLIMTDQQRFDSLGCYGADWIDTPNLDRLSAEGVQWDRCYVNNPVCTPSRASIWTGKELPGHGVYQLHDLLPSDERLFTERLQEAGYHTALFGKLHVSGRIFEAAGRHPHVGFDEYEWCIEASIDLDSPYNGYGRWLREHHRDFYTRLKQDGRKVLHHPQEVHFTHWAAERAIDFIDRFDPAVPFFCCMSVFDPHNPYEDYPEEMTSRVHREKIPPRLSDPRTDLPDGVLRERHRSYLGDFDSFREEDIDAMRLGYFASVALIDEEVGRVLAALEKKGLRDNTLVIFVSDHGDMVGDHDLTVKGAYFYDACTRVPLLMRWPGRLKGGTRVAGVVQPHDIAATILSAAGLPLPADSDGRDLLPAAGGGEAAREYAVCAYRNSGICDSGEYWDPPIDATMITDGHFKLTLFHREPEAGGRELYDLERDPTERVNLYRVKDPSAQQVRLLGALADWMVGQDAKHNGGRGGSAVPAASQRLRNTLK